MLSRAAVVLAGALVVLTVGSASAPSTSTDGLPRDLMRAIEAFDRAQVNADTTTLARLVTDDCVLVNSDASIDRKPKYLADFLLPGLRMEPYVIEQRIEKVWSNTAVVFGLQRLSWRQDGTRHQRVLRVVHVRTKQSGRWQVTHTLPAMRRLAPGSELDARGYPSGGVHGFAESSASQLPGTERHKPTPSG